MDHNSRSRDDDAEPIDELIDERRRREPWHVGRDIPLALIITIVAQTAGAVWWASGQSSKLDRAIEMISEFRVDRYTKDDGRRDQQLISQMMESFRQTDRELERRLLGCEQHMTTQNGNSRTR